MDGILMLLISTLTPWLLERMKWSRFVPFMQPVAPVLNRVTPLVLAAIVAAGVTFQFDQSTGVLMVSGLVPSEMVRGILLWITGSGVQELSYRRAIKIEAA